MENIVETKRQTVKSPLALECQTFNMTESTLTPKTNESENFSKFTLANMVSLPSSLTEHTTRWNAQAQLNAASPMGKYTERMVEDILSEIFKERRGDYPETSSSCHTADMAWSFDEREPHVDKRLRYWKEVLQQRKKMQQRVQRETGKLASEVLFNRRSTLDNRDGQTVKQVLDYADRMKCERLMSAPISKLADQVDPCTCQVIPGLEATTPKAERVGYKDVEVIGLPEVCQRELLGKEALHQIPPPGWLQSEFLDKRLEQRFPDIQNVVQFFPDVDALQVEGTAISKLKRSPKPVLVDVDSMHTVTQSDSSPICSEECVCESCGETEEKSSGAPPPIPDVGLRVNGVNYIPCEEDGGGLKDCYEIVARFSCDPFRRRFKRVLQLTNIGKQSLSFSWKQSTYYYNRGSLLLAQDNEFHFDLEGFRLSHGETRNVAVLYQPRKVAMAVELWLLQVEPRIFCGRQESLLLRLYGRCTPPADYMAKLLECQCVCICKSDAVAIDKLTTHLGALAPMVVPPPACCPYERPLDDREAFNALNPGYSCARFDDLEVLRAFHQRLKKPREPLWDLRLSTIKDYIMRIKGLLERESIFSEFNKLLAPLLGGVSSSNAKSTKQDEQKQRSRFIYVRGVICNGIAEWEDLMFNVEDSFFKPELQRYYHSLLGDSEEGEEEKYGEEPEQPKPMTPIDMEKLMEILGETQLDEKKIRTAVIRKLYRSKYFRDALYIQTYSHLCNISEDIVSVIESTEIVPT
ncbi:uncharacterized protein LOC6528394 [Drosophila yakuba]|uniref:Uncharacterized protein n=1 Tax=Drosophila yakuba TaxID=7245 RepID=B4P1F1_DROYA|nr:uncharacterized protein LOC6528394 [Drosophila yakuba]EDW89153.1 uncharacterized protein Dyak_GE19113 [Drosophila yakuba]